MPSSWTYPFYSDFLFGPNTSTDKQVEITLEYDNLGEATVVIVVEIREVFATNGEIIMITSWVSKHDYLGL